MLYWKVKLKEVKSVCPKPQNTMAERELQLPLEPTQSLQAYVLLLEFFLVRNNDLFKSGRECSAAIIV